MIFVQDVHFKLRPSEVLGGFNLVYFFYKALQWPMVCLTFGNVNELDVGVHNFNFLTLAEKYKQHTLDWTDWSLCIQNGGLLNHFKTGKRLILAIGSDACFQFLATKPLSTDYCCWYSNLM